MRLWAMGAVTTRRICVITLPRVTGDRHLASG
jgi:hypothetical protein